MVRVLAGALSLKEIRVPPDAVRAAPCCDLALRGALGGPGPDDVALLAEGAVPEGTGVADGAARGEASSAAIRPV